MNELIFFLHTALMATSLAIALRLGRQGLVAAMSLQAVLANLFVTKQMLFLGMCVTTADVYSIGTGLSLNLLQDYWGKETARNAIWVSFFCLVMYTIMAQLQLLYIPASCDVMHPHFAVLLQPMLRITAASLASYLVCQYLDSAIFERLKQKTPFAFRSSISLLSSQLLDTVLFSFLGLYGMVDNITDIVIISYLIKVIAIALAVPFVSICRTYIKR